MATSMKRDKPVDDNEEKNTMSNGEEDGDEWIGPLPTDASEVPKKKKKVLAFEHVYLNMLPSAEGYERSYMHRDVITHVVCSKTGFIITASCDGHVKFWKKEDEGIEFVKHFRAHLGNVQHMSDNVDGTLLNTISNDKSLKVFDVINFDMINMMRLKFCPVTSEWIHSGGDVLAAIAVADDSGKIFIFDGRGTQDPIHCLEKLHASPVCFMKYNPVYEVVVSADTRGMIEYWNRHTDGYTFPSNSVEFKFKTDTDLYEFAKHKTFAACIAFSPNGKLMATIAKDRKVRIFKFLTGKLSKVLNEDISVSNEINQEKQLIPTIEFGRRAAMEKEIDRTSTNFSIPNLLFDASGNFLLYPSLLGVKVLNLLTNSCVRLIGKGENARFLQIALFQGVPSKFGTSGTITAEMQASDNPALQSVTSDPTLFCTGYKKNRFYMFTRREPTDDSAGGDRDVFNEKPSKEDIIAATETEESKKLSNSCMIHTTMGDIHCKLFLRECPKTVENFCVHSKNGYYNGHVFHRVIKSFMVQTGDPTGTGTGGQSIWGGEFEDEFHPTLKHDRPYTLSMANAGPNTNGSQFFITVVPCPWLDGKHTVFGRVTKGMEVVQNISSAKTHPKTDKPYDDISIVSVSLKL